ncbi:MAG: bifunctional metallophosphatase/5'-nucleotidase, partial [Sphingomicrobium sp.]
MRRFFVILLSAALAACATVPRSPAGLVEIQILAINDFHGNLEPPKLTVPTADGAVPAGGAAYLATALKQSRTVNSVTVAAGDLIGASPISSALFLDEPSITALNLAGLELASVGNHEFDKGVAELKRMQSGGCVKVDSTTRTPCRLEPFAGAKFSYLAANVLDASGASIFPASAIKTVGGVRIGFIGMTLKATGTLVTPAGVAGVHFTDEADTANALVPGLKAAGAQAIVLLVHQGGALTGRYDDQGCPGLSGDILPILDRLDPAIRLVVSGHTHNAYICHRPIAGGGERLLTSAGKYGAMVTDVRLTFDRTEGLIGERGSFVIVQGEAIATARLSAPLVPSHPVFAADPAVANLVQRYHDAASTEADRPVGKLNGTLVHSEDLGVESSAPEFITDAQLFVARGASMGRADLALMNNGGARTDLLPDADGSVRFGQIFAMQPFANSIVTRTYTGAQLKAVLEQQFDSGRNTVAKP